MSEFLQQLLNGLSLGAIYALIALVLVAALALNLILRPSSSQTRKPRQRRLRLAWPDRPASWRARFCMMPRRRNADAERPLRGAPRDIRVVASFPLARRLWRVPFRLL